MKKLIMPIMALFLICSCNKDNTLFQEVNPITSDNLATLDKQFKPPYDLKQLPVAVQKVYKELTAFKKDQFQNPLSATSRANPNRSVEPVFRLEEDAVTIVKGHIGRSLIFKTNKDARFRWESRGFKPNNAYVFWVLVLNIEEGCTIYSPESGLGFEVINLGGTVTNRLGQLNFSATLKHNDNSNSVLFPFPSPGLLDSKKAHFVLFAIDNGPYTGNPNQLIERLGQETQISEHFLCERG